MSPTAKLIIAPSLCVLLAFQAFAASLTVTKPEEVGFSAERLKRVHSVIQSHIDAKDFAGAVTLVARKGKVVHFEAQGTTDMESGKAMRTDTLFRMASMTKPLTAVAVLMLMEEGKLVLAIRFRSSSRSLRIRKWRCGICPMIRGARGSNSLARTAR